jgi:hypothetical protein
MATTAAEILQYVSQAEELINTVSGQINGFESQFQALLANPSQPNAMNQFNSLVTQRTTVADTWNNNTVYSQMIQLFNSAPQGIKNQVESRVQSTRAAAESLVKVGRTQKFETIPKTKEAIENAIKDNEEQPQDDENEQPGSNEPGTSSKNLTGEADGDSSSEEDPAANQTTGASQGVGGTSARVNGKAAADPKSSPGRRLKNPLGYFSSSTYQISLYMVTPDAYDAFILSGRRNIQALQQAGGGNQGAGAYIIAQSGGINNTTSKRAPGFNFDYYIDNLKIETATNGKETGTATNVTDMSFTIVEPYGFSFITKLKNASAAIQQYSKKLAGVQNPTKQFFILGIRFLGYDENGNIMTGKEQYDGLALDEKANPNGLFENFYDILLTSIKFKIDGRATTYNIKAAAISPTVSFGIKRGFLNSNAKIQGATVEDALEGPDGFITKLNADQENLLSAGKIKEKNNYKVTWIGGGEEIRESSIVLPEDLDKSKWATSNAKNSSESNDSEGANAAPNNTVRNIQFNRDSPALQVISQIISQSSYLRDALRVVYTSQVEPNTEKNSENQNDPNTKKTISWYNLSAEVTNARWDTVTGDFAYDINYLIQPYETPVLDSAYANPGVKYYGPHKRYDYWYTGKNSEILSYEQNLDNTYFNVVLDPTVGSSTGIANAGGNDVATVPNRPTSQNKQGTLDKGKEAQNNYLTTLYDPGAYARAKITIMGDPDFLIQESASSINAVYSKFYGTDGFTINPNGGQVFIEIDFKEAIDYDTQKGYLSINDSILFWKYPEDISKLVKGVSYMVIKVISNFSSGKFTQSLECTINTFGDSGTSSQETNNRETTGQTTGSSATTANTGLTKDSPPADTKTTTSDPPSTNDNAPSTNTGTSSGADDDGGP